MSDIPKFPRAKFILLNKHDTTCHHSNKLKNKLNLKNLHIKPVNINRSYKSK